MRTLLIVLVFCTFSAADKRSAIALLYTELDTKDAVANNKMVGYAEFSQENSDSDLEITIVLFQNGDLTNGKHGFHIHNYGNMLGGCALTLGHYNPLKQLHGGPTDVIRHVGDLGNIQILNNQYTGKLVDKTSSLYGRHSVIGRGVVLHSGKDDLGKGGDTSSEATGNAGSRYACGVISVNSDNFNRDTKLAPSLVLVLAFAIIFSN